MAKLIPAKAAKKAPDTKKNHTQLNKVIELNDELENYFRNTIIPQLFVDADLILRKFTPPAMKQFRFKPEHIGRPMEEMVDNIRYSTILENIKEVIKTEEIFEKEIQTTDMRWFQMNIIPYVVKKEKRTNGVIITFVDITDRMRILKELERLNASHETFIYSVSHDLKAPLANIEGLVQLMVRSSAELVDKTGTDNEEQTYIAKLLNKAVVAMRTIITELSEVAKIEGNYKEVAETVSFATILNDVELTIKEKIIERNAAITYDLNVKKVNFSRKNLRSIIYNLLSNAIKFVAPDKTPAIHIKTGKEKGFIYLSISDNGPGIAEENHDQIFTPFTRFTTDVEGTGIGLYLVKKIVENEGGKIVLHSKEGEGSEFIIYLKKAKKNPKPKKKS